MGFKQYIRSEYGKVIISIILGFGLSTLFRKKCSDKKCMKFKGPSQNEIKKNIYKFDDQCYQFKPNPTKCNSEKKIVRFA
jgi:hypothetical protein